MTSKVATPCLQCSTDVLALPSDRARGKGRYCSPRCRQESQRRWASQRERSLFRKYKLTLAGYDDLWVAQGKRCAMCGCTSTRRWDVDHDHACCPGQVTCGECVRGIICRECNYYLRILEDRQITEAASRYIKASQARRGKR